MKWHWPRFYRTLIADPGFRGPMWNEYPPHSTRNNRRQRIGACVVIGRYSYNVKWGWAR